MGADLKFWSFLLSVPLSSRRLLARDHLALAPVFLRFWCPMHPFVGPVPFVTAALRLGAKPNADIPRENQ
ncbi:hypothetical protein PAPYR_4471 [Paratrimastix pyriformis]|uniref:Uncharacterized protein n=1 Tax=Paratrimastix pyriformis TaxID=342808 RepID=A0ABQ8ULU0_9EUKA|nr:hypothetical protein PAPYR_4471 [Paratrimastix pyriformis]